MKISEKAMKSILNYGIYVRLIINGNEELEYLICNKSDEMVLCDNIYSIKELEIVLEEWGMEN